MIKAGWNSFCNRIVFIDTPREQRVWRARQRGWSQEDFDRREAAQESLDAKRAHADAVIDNSGSLEAETAVRSTLCGFACRFSPRPTDPSYSN